MVASLGPPGLVEDIRMRENCVYLWLSAPHHPMARRVHGVCPGGQSVLGGGQCAGLDPTMSDHDVLSWADALRDLDRTFEPEFISEWSGRTFAKWIAMAPTEMSPGEYVFMEMLKHLVAVFPSIPDPKTSSDEILATWLQEAVGVRQEYVSWSVAESMHTYVDLSLRDFCASLLWSPTCHACKTLSTAIAELPDRRVSAFLRKSHAVC